MPPNGVANGNHATRRLDLALVVSNRGLFSLSLCWRIVHAHPSSPHPVRPLTVTVVRRRRRLRARHHKRPRQYETMVGIHSVQTPAWHTTGAGLRPRESLPAAPEVLQAVENGNVTAFL